MKYPVFFAVAFVVIACSKKSETADPISSDDKAKAAALTEVLKANNFRLARYYSETPIDYIDTDQVVKQETQLWSYVSIWLKDDDYRFNGDGIVSVEQNLNRIKSDSSPVLTRSYNVVADPQGVAFNFIGHEYQALDYRLISFTDSNLTVSATWNGKKVISEYRTVP